MTEKLGYRVSPSQKEKKLYMTPGEMMNSKNTTQMTTAKFGNQSDSKVKEFDEELGAEVEWQSSIDIEMEDGDVPDERE